MTLAVKPSGDSAQPNPKLKKFIQESEHTLSISTLVAYMRVNTPKLFSRLRRGPRNVDLVSLYTLLGLPTEGSCLVCGSNTRILRWETRPRRYCSSQCATNSPDKAYRLSAASANAEANRIASRRPMTSRPEEYPRLRSLVKKMLAEVGTPAPRDPLRRYIQQHYPELHEDVKLSRGGMDLDRLYSTLALPNTGTCLYCSGVTFIPRASLRPTLFCGPSCASTYKEIHGEKNSCRLHTYTAKNGTNHLYQGYEGILLKRLDASPSWVKAFSTVKGTDELPTVRYSFGGRRRRYFPDISVIAHEGRRLVVEVKSHYTLHSHFEKNMAKFQAASEHCTRLGLEFWLVVVNKRSLVCKWYQDGRVN